MEEETHILEEVDKLNTQHRSLDDHIAELEHSGNMKDQLQLRRLKKMKLQIKDRVTYLESLLYPDIIA